MNKEIRLSADGKLRILQITDLHEHYDEEKWGKISEAMVRALIRSENPDLLVFTGDISSLDRIDKVMRIPEELGVPTAITLGNREPAYEQRREYLDICRSYSCCINPEPTLPDSRCATFFLPVLNAEGTKTVYGLWFCDTAPDAEPDGGEYVTPEQIEWFKTEHAKQKALNNGEPLPSLWFYHIVFPEVYDALIEVKPGTPRGMPCFYDKSRRFIPDAKTLRGGELNEMPWSFLQNYGMFDTMVEAGGVKACFSGHDHDNTFVIRHKGVDIVNSPKGCYRGVFNAFHGGRRITVDLKHPDTYSSEIVTFSSLYDKENFDKNKDILLSDNKTVRLVRFCKVRRQIEDVVTAYIPEFFKKVFGYKKVQGERLWKVKE